MCWKSKNVYIGKDSLKNLFLKKSRENIYNMFFDMDWDVLKDYKFQYIGIEFHLTQDKGFVYFIKYMEYKGGRTIFSCMREMVKYLISWRVDGFGHFTVSI